jgi:hypothetical protein
MEVFGMAGGSEEEFLSFYYGVGEFDPKNPTVTSHTYTRNDNTHTKEEIHFAAFVRIVEYSMQPTDAMRIIPQISQKQLNYLHLGT